MEKRNRGRPMTSRDVKITPEFRENPDIEKLGQALIAAAMNLAEKKRAEEATKKGSQGESMT
nr:hypothetical protein [uncultured Oscillibacter sp.]